MSTTNTNRERPETGGPDTARRDCLHHLIEDQVRRTPDACAVRCGAETLTYADLNRRANIVARRLIDAGIGARTPVGVLLERSAELVVALLGVLKSGGFYLPIDVATPPERVRFLLDDAGVNALLTAIPHASRLTGYAGRTILLGPTPLEESPGGSENPAGRTTLATPAYLIYTSGSTGKPKGVVIPHRGLANYVTWAAEAYRVAEGAGSLVHGSPAFDLIMTGLYCPLVAGRTVDILPEGAGPDQLAAALIRGRHYSLVKLTPAHLELLRTLIPPEDSGTLARYFVVGGEALEGRLVAEWRERAPGTRIVNEYGPTETVVGCCAYVVPPDGDLPANIPIGRPIAGTHMYILDGSLNEVPPGEPGELYIGGEGVALGYLGRPELTAERFLPDPHVPGALMYRSGDRARVDTSGTFICLGRDDDQIKVRGHRVEPGEIESALREHAEVREAVVLPRPGGAREASLIAFVIRHPGEELHIEGLKGFLGARLPDYMIPSAFVTVDALPLTPNGKIDRKGLLALVPRHTQGEDEPPRTDVERILAGWWKEILGIQTVRRGDSFFDLGGHSLLVAQVIARVREKYGIRLPYREMFDHPTLASLAAVIAWGTTRPGGNDPMAIRPVPRPQRLPLSFAQEAVWFFLQLRPENVAYNAQTMLRFSGSLDEAALQRALSEMIRRHEILRTSFHAAEAGPVQVVHPPVASVLPVVACDGADERAREEDLARRVRKEVRTQFDLASYPLIRCTLFRMNAREHVFLLVEHHFVHDGWSVNLFLGELRDLYAAFAAGRPSPLAPLLIQFADYALWQRSWMTGADAARQLAYWKTRLAGLPPVQALPSDRPRPEVQKFEGASFRHELPEDLCDALRAFSHAHGVSLFMTMLGSFMTLLHRYGGEKDLCVGSGMGNRSTPETEKLLGMMVNTVAMRLNLADDPTVEEMLARAREMCLEAYSHQAVPFDKVVEAVRPERSLQHSPLYQVLFGFHDSPIDELAFPGLRTELNDTVGNGTAKVDINVIVIPRTEQRTRQRAGRTNRGITFKWEYDTSIYDEATMHRMVDHFEVLLRGVVADPGVRVSGLPLLPEGERKLLLEEWSQGRGEYPRGAGIVRVFSGEALAHGESVALECGPLQMSYGELDRRSSQCARYLVRRGVLPGAVVGLALDRSLEVIVGMLGILKAGGAYCPLEVSQPEARLRYMMEEARIATVVTVRSAASRFAAPGVTVVCLDEASGEMAREEETGPSVEVTGESLAYAMYTSGSTGRPKCVAVVHDAVVRLVRGQSYVALGPEEVLLQYAPVSFDASTFEIWGALLNGGKLVIMPAGRYSLEEVGSVVRSSGVTTLWLTAALFHHMVDGPLELFGGLHQLLSGGDVLGVGHVQKFARRYPSCRVINGYGPTENTTFTCCYTVQEAEGLGATVPIGRPIGNTYVYVLDEHRRPVPLGVPGELYIGGDGLARGYLQEPELTEEHFVADPFAPGKRLYRSGDRVRYLADGNIEFLGRIDAQVKIRGYRIEPGEIEAVLAEAPGVRESLVLAREDVPGEKRLVAYLRAQPGTTEETLAEHLRKSLPDYMIPAAWVMLEAFPVTPNGKIDKHALPAPVIRPERSPAAPSGGTLAWKIEGEIREIWRGLLGRADIGGSDNFFALGGHSLLAMQFVTRMKSTWDVTIKLAEVFRYPTAQALAMLIEDQFLKQMESMSADEIMRRML